MELKQKFINGSLYDVLSPEEYMKRYREDNELVKNTVIKNGDYVYFPTTDDKKSKPHAVIADVAIKYSKVQSKYEEKFTAKDIIDYSDSKSIKDILRKQDKLHERDYSLQYNAGQNSEVFMPVIRQGDSGPLKLVKEAIRAKRISMEDYKTRFSNSSEYSNMVRLLTNKENHAISINKVKSFGEKLDMKFELSVTDVDSSIKNPIGATLKMEV